MRNPNSNCKGRKTLMELFEKTGKECEEKESAPFSEDWFEDEDLNHKIDNILMNGDLDEGVAE